jgi:hypothetical protein
MLNLKLRDPQTRARKRKTARRGFTVRLQIERLEERNLLAITGTPNQEFVAQAYLDLLHRQVDPSGLAFWTGLVDQGTSRTQVVRDIQASLEFRTDEIENAYQTLLGRGADAAGFNGMLARLAGGATIDQVNEIIYGSAEFVQHSGGTNEGFLDNLYPNLVGRAIDSGGDAGWNLVLTSGISRQEVATLISNGSEYARHQVQLLYSTFLHRTADSVGLNAFAAEEPALGIDGISAILVGSAEYFQLVQLKPPGLPGTHPTTLTVTSSPGGAVPLNTPVTFTASLAPFADSLNSTDNEKVTFTEGGTILGTGTLKNGVAAFASQALTAGGHTITAVFQGDSNFAANSNQANVNVSLSPEATTLALISLAPQNSSISTPIQFQATLALATPGPVTPGGTVTFKDVGSGATLGNPVAVTGLVVDSNPVLFSTVGVHTIQAVYSGDNNFLSAPSPTITQTISNNPQPIVAIVSSTNGTSNLGTSVFFTATVTAPPGVNSVPMGNVKFQDDQGNDLGLGTVPLILDVATGKFVATSNAVTTLTGGSHNIVAQYLGNAQFSGATSPAITQRVVAAPTTVTLGAPSFASLLPGVPGTITATVNGLVNGFPLTGQLTFSVTDAGGNVITQQTVPVSQNTLQIPALDVGTFTITAIYSSDPNYAPSQNSTSVTIAQGTVTATVGTPTITSEGVASVTVTVSTNAPAPLKGGSVSITVNGSPLSGITLNGGSATFTVSNLTFQPNAQSTITVQFSSSDKNYASNPNAGSRTVTYNDEDDPGTDDDSGGIDADAHFS